MLSSHITRYVALSRRLGLQFDEQERTLELYASYAEAHGDRYTLVKRIYEWCATASSPQALEPRQHIVPAVVLPTQPPKYSSGEVELRPQLVQLQTLPSGSGESLGHTRIGTLVPHELPTLTDA